MARVYIGNLDPRVTERELEDEFRLYGVLRSKYNDQLYRGEWIYNVKNYSFCGKVFKNYSLIMVQEEVYCASVWVARRPPGYAFIEFDDRRDALDAIRELDGKNGWRVELSHNSKDGGGGRGGRGRSGGDSNCYECGEPGHFARECRLRIGSRGLGSGRRRSPSPRRRGSPIYGRRSYSPRGRRSPPRRGRSYSRSPSYRRSRRDSPYANGD